MEMKRQYKPEPEPERLTASYAQGEAEAAPDPEMDLALDLCMQQHPCAPSEELVDAGKQEVRYCVQEKLREAGYLPPPPPPLAAARSLQTFAEEALGRMEHLPANDPVTAAFREALSLVDAEVQAESKAALQFFEKLNAKLRPAVAPFSRVAAIAKRLDAIIDRAGISLEPPPVSKEMTAKMRDVERFLVQEWTENAERGVLAIYADEESQTTVLQIGIAQYGPVYITIPRVLRPDDVAVRSLRELLGRVSAFQAEVDPLAVVDGAYPALNFNSLFMNSRVIRAASGDTARLAANLGKTRARQRLSPKNTVIINSSPATLEQYLRVFPQDPRALHWSAWGGEAAEWNRIAETDSFGHTAEASRETVLAALTRKENVIVIVAHSDGKTLFMPDPRPKGTQISADYLPRTSRGDHGKRSFRLPLLV